MKAASALGRIAGIALFAILGLLCLGTLLWLLLPKGPREPLAFDDPWHQDRPLVVARHQAAAAGTPWATDAALDVLDRGGNAFDAAAAALLMINVTHGEAASFPSVAPLMLYDAKSGEVRSYIGAGKAPAAATLERFTSKGYKTVPDLNILSQLLPASPDVLVSLLSDYGTMSFAEIAAPAIRMAREGFPVHEIMYKNMHFSLLNRVGFQVLLPYNTKVWLGGQFWRPIFYKDRISFPELADSLQALADAETSARSAGVDRRAGLQALRDYFYKGPLAEAIVDLHRRRGGLFTAEDLADYKGGWERPVRGGYGDYEYFANGTWSQGAVAPLTLQILEGIDLRSLGHNSPAYIHVVAQAIELAMADREAYMADPAFVRVPLSGLMSKAYAASRRARMTKVAFPSLPPPGNPGAFSDKPGQPGLAAHEPAQGQAAAFAPGRQPPSTGPDTTPKRPLSYPTPGAPDPQKEPVGGEGPLLSLLAGAKIGKDTTQLAVIDRWGNAIAMTPSDFPKSPMVPGTGLTLGDRMTQFRLDPASPNVVAPGKRPRISPQAAVVFKGGKFWMAYSSPGEDVQTQALVQVFLNMTVFGMDLQQAIEAPRFRDVSMPASFAPHRAYPATLLLEAPLYDGAAAGLKALGYKAERLGAWDNTCGAVGAVIKEGGRVLAGSDPREEGTAAGD